MVGSGNGEDAHLGIWGHHWARDRRSRQGTQAHVSTNDRVDAGGRIRQSTQTHKTRVLSFATRRSSNDTGSRISRPLGEAARNLFVRAPPISRFSLLQSAEDLPHPDALLGTHARRVGLLDHDTDSIGGFTMGDKGSKDKSKREKQNKAKLSVKEKRRIKQGKNSLPPSPLMSPPGGK